MKLFSLSIAAVVSLGCTATGYGLGLEQLGPVEGRNTVVQQHGWPHGMVEIVGHNSRVYSRWVNGSEDFYFQATTGEIEELIDLYSNARLREHTLIVQPGKGTARTFDGKPIEFNVGYSFPGGISRYTARNGAEAKTYEPTLTIYVDAIADKEWWSTVNIPDSFIVHSETLDWPAKSSLNEPKRRWWHASLLVDERPPAASIEKGEMYQVTLWEKDSEKGICLGAFGPQGQFSVALSEQEISALKSGKAWLTLTAGGHETPPTKEDAKLDVDYLSPNKSAVKPIAASDLTTSKGRRGR